MKILKQHKLNLTKIVIFLLLVIWPFIVHSELVATNLSHYSWYPDMPQSYDFFMHVRSNTFLALAVLMLLILLDYGMIQRKKVFKLNVMAPVIVYVVLVIISTVLSVNKQLSIVGMSEQYENVWVLLAYMVVFWFGYTMSRERITVQEAMTYSMFGGVIQCLIGFSQMLHHDFWNTPLGLKILFWGRSVPGNLKFSFDERERIQAYISFYNPNFASVYLILMIPIALAAVWYMNRIWKKICSGLLVVGYLICLYGTGSKTSLIVLPVIAVLFICFGVTNKKIKRWGLGGIALAGIVMICVILFSPNNSRFGQLRRRMSLTKNENHLQDFEQREDGVIMTLDSKRYKIMPDVGGKVKVIEEGGKKCELYTDEDGRCYQADLKDLEYRPLFSSFSQGPNSIIRVYYSDGVWEFEKNADDPIYYYLNKFGKRDVIQRAPSAFGEGYEGGITMRIYLWAREIPLLKNYLFIGSGPDTFAVVFPQNDYVYRRNTSRVMMESIITRAHSFYLQQAIQTGVLSLVALLVLIGRYVIQAIGCLWKNDNHTSEQRVIQTALLCSVIGFLITGITYDSVVVVSPIFWLLLGLGYRSIGDHHRKSNLLTKYKERKREK